MDAKFFVPFETAKLCKEKGYPQVYADCYYRGTENNWEMIVSQYAPTEVRIGRTQNQEYIAAPTYHEVVAWLEGKNVRIEVSMKYRERTQQWLWIGKCVVVEDEDYETQQYASWCSTREEALNAAILKALEMI